MNAYCMWDSDGIAFPFTEKFSEFVGWPEGEWSSWSEYKSYGWTTDEFLAKLKEFTDGGGFRHADPYEDFVPAFQTLVDLGVIPIVVTDKMTDKGVADNAAWLRDIGCEPERIIKSKDKTDILSHVAPGDVVFGVDDNIDHVESMIGAGILAAVRDRPWNVVATHLPRVHDLRDFASEVSQDWSAAQWLQEFTSRLS